MPFQICGVLCVQFSPPSSTGVNFDLWKIYSKWLAEHSYLWYSCIEGNQIQAQEIFQSLKMADICLFNKFGHCRFQTTFRKRHVGKICEKDQCNIQSCSERHPRECTYYRDFGRCKFGTYCSFRHRNSKDEKIKEQAGAELSQAQDS